jgi:hypothetical protein
MRRVRIRDLIFWSSSSTLFAVACLCLSLYLNNVYGKHLQNPESCGYDIIVLHYSGLIEQSLLGASFLTLFFSAGTLLFVVLFARQIRSHKTTQPAGE